MTIHIGWPQFIYIVLLLIGLVRNAIYHGEKGEVNFFRFLLAVCIVLPLLFWGGFFR